MLSLKGQHGTYIIAKNQSPQGKFGGVMLGKRLEDQLPVAAKKLTAAQSAAEEKKRRIIASLNHPNLAPTLETIEQDGDTYLIRPFISGTSFKSIFKKYSLHTHLGTDFYVQSGISILQGLEYLHNQGVVHLDIKPSNIIVKHGEKTHPSQWHPDDVVLIDFEQAATYPPDLPARAPFAMVYSPPEQLLNYNRLVNPSSDIFALSVTLYEMLAGSPPWVDCNAEILLHLQLTYAMKRPWNIGPDLFDILAKGAYKEKFPLPPRRLAPEVIEEIVSKGIAQRYTSAKAYGQALAQYLAQHPEIKKKPGWIKRLGRRMGFKI